MSRDSSSGLAFRGPALGVALVLAFVVPKAGGTLRWQAPFGLGGTPYALVVSPDGRRVYVTGCNGSAAGCSKKYMTVAHNATNGAVIWYEEYGGISQSPDTAYAIGVSPDGTVVYVTGVSDDGVFATLAYDSATGAQLWEKRYKAAGYPCCLVVSPDGSRVYVAGTGGSQDFSTHYATVAYDATTGDQLWEAKYSGAFYNSGHALGVSSDGARVFVTGESQGDGFTNDYATVAYNAATGTQLWATRYDDPAKPGDSAYALAVAPDGSAVYVTGCLGNFDYCVQADVGTVAYDAASGDQLWVAAYDGPVHGDDSGVDIGTSPDGSKVYVAAASDQLTSADFAVVAYDEGSGDQLWLGTYDGPTNENEYTCCLDASPDGSSVVVTGSSLELGVEQFATVSFDATTGGIRWAARNKGGHQGYNSPQDVAFSPDSRGVYVTESTVGPSHHYDFLTVAYRS